MGNQKIINLLIDSGSQPSGFATKKWYVIEVVCKFGVLKQLFGTENHTRKLSNNLKGLKLLIIHLLCQNVPLFSLYICLTRRFNAFWSGIISVVLVQKSDK